MRSLLSARSLLLAIGMLLLCCASYAQFGVVVSVGFPPPELPVYEQPICPGDGYIWTPGYWAWDGYDYYWVPGTWVLAPEVGFFWTPPYWGWGGSAFIFHEGYWGPVVGFYGGVNYGFGYFGRGYDGGRWEHDHFYYNRAVNNVNVTVIHNVYETRIENIHETRVSYNGGQGGIEARPTSQELAAEHERHIAPVAAQTQHMQQARNIQELRASVNHGKPPIAATAKPSEFKQDVRPATSATHYNPPPQAVHPNELPAIQRPSTSNVGKQDQKNQQEQQKLYARQEQERQKLQQQQEQEHQQAERQNYNQAQRQEMEQRHQQQTQQMAQQHFQERQQMAQHQQPPPHEGRPK
jgi:WXXGXW repeat (2 copies)